MTVSLGLNLPARETFKRSVVRTKIKQVPNTTALYWKGSVCEIELRQRSLGIEMNDEDHSAH